MKIMSEVFSLTPDVWAECVRSSEGNRFFNEIIQICSNTSQQLGYKPLMLKQTQISLQLRFMLIKKKTVLLWESL